jgi:hypothetical protein
VELVKVWAAWLSDTEKQAAFGWDAAGCTALAAILNAFLSRDPSRKPAPPSDNNLPLLPSPS